MLTLIRRKNRILLPSEYSDETSGSCTSKKISAATIRAVTRMTMPSRLRRLVSSHLRSLLDELWRDSRLPSAGPGLSASKTNEKLTF